MLFELTDYNDVSEFCIKYGHFTITKIWKRKKLQYWPFSALKIECVDENYWLYITDKIKWTTCEFFMVNECPMFLFQTLPDDDYTSRCFLCIPQLDSGTSIPTFSMINLRGEQRNPFYKRIYIYSNRIIFCNPEKGSLTINMKFIRSKYTINEKNLCVVVPNIISKTRSHIIPDHAYISTVKHPTCLANYQLPLHLVSKNNYICYQFGNVYICGEDGPNHVLVTWNLKYIKYMSKKTRLYIQHILLCIQRKKLYKWIPKILWKTYILPSVVFHIPMDQKPSCSIF